MAAVAVLWALASLLSVFVLNWAISLSPDDVVVLVERWQDLFAPASSTVAAVLDPVLDRLITGINRLADPLAETMFRLVIAWLVLWLAGMVLRRAEPDMKSASRSFRFIFHAIKYARRLVAGALLVVVVASWLERPFHDSVRPLLIIVVIWLIFRFSELLTARLWPDPRDTGFWRRLLRHLLILGRRVTFALLVGLGILALLDQSRSPATQPMEILGMDALFVWVREIWLSAVGATTCH